ncbi:peptidase M64 [candidate division KSB1 bacterium]|nr:peptidase M64 [candidate division KSB1 bacterium]
MLKIRYPILFLLLLTFRNGITTPDFDQFFVDQTMRIDYYHTGTRNVDIFSLDQVYAQGRWAGSKTNLLDTLNLGKYLAKVVDAGTNALIYSRGFCSLFGEWQTTPEATTGNHQTFHESVLVPLPRDAVNFVLAIRGNDGRFHDKWSIRIDPNSRFISREGANTNARVSEMMINGEPENKIDLLIIGDGYTKDDMSQFRKAAKTLTKTLFNVEPFKKREKDFNVRRIEIASQESGIDEPRSKIWKNTACGCSFNSFDSPRYVLSFHNKAIRDIAANAPYDALYLLFNSERYGGGGIFNLYAVCYSGTKRQGESWWAEYVFVHELGHSLAGLADEYYTSSVAYEEFYPAGVEPWEPNITALSDPQALKWRHLVQPQTPIPTPWEKARYDSLDAELRKVNRLSPDYLEQIETLRTEMETLLRSQTYWGEAGAFEGAGYLSKGMYRPYLDCRMFSKSLVDFDPVCQAAIERVIDFYSR